ncbi:hypothetical protein RRG08_037014 [Elysia crispata]|uniref:G-protein coupled receptors family 1 profile domain-containing protein n=1 Tax=Elysia crispata TaxID=231223 RepID=A0AAE0XUY4_9GAST|nr:hypothetical protein RRG08_037014 [Elysia crispata]
MSDLTFLTLISPTMWGFAIDALVRPSPWPFDQRLLFFLLYYPAYVTYDLSAFISVSLGVIRCACVTMPLKFKLVFTKSRTIKWLLLLVVLAVALRMPLLTINRIAWRTDPETNLSTPYLVAVNRLSITKAADILNRGFVLNFSFIIMVACVLVLTYNLYRASMVRRTFTAKRAPTSDQFSEKSAAKGLSSRDLQVVKSVVLVCSIYILTQVPNVNVSCTRLIDPKFDDGSGFDDLFGIIAQINNTCSYLNASVNIFVYYNYNSKFRPVFCSLLTARCAPR